jgi:hypothetical protein
MKCRGSLSFASTNNASSAATKTNGIIEQLQQKQQQNEADRIKSQFKSSLPICQGIATRLQAVREYPPMKANAALSAFKNQSSFYHPEEDENGYNGYNNDNDDNDDKEQSQMDRRRRRSTSSFGVMNRNPNNMKKKVNKEIRMNDLPLIVDKQWDRLKSELDKKSDVDMSQFNSNQPQQSLSSSTNKNKHHLNFLGTTDVYLLVLRPFGNELNSEDNGNDSERKVQHSSTSLKPSSSTSTNTDTNTKTSTKTSPFQLPLNPFPDQRTPLHTIPKRKIDNDKDAKKQHEEEGDDMTDIMGSENNKKNKNDTQSIIYAVAPVNKMGVSKRQVKDGKGLSCSSKTIKLGILEIHMSTFEDGIADEAEVKNTSMRTGLDNESNDIQMKDNNDGKHNDDDDDTVDSSTIMGTMSSNWDQGKQLYDKLEKMEEKIYNSMKQNAKIIKKEFENDFINRSFKASEKIVGNFGKTMYRMEKAANDLWKMFSDDDNDD